MPQQSVRFQGFLPSAEGKVPSPVPPISPSQAASAKQQTVLRSIFSPAENKENQWNPAYRQQVDASQKTPAAGKFNHLTPRRRPDMKLLREGGSPVELFFSPAQTVTSSLAGSPFSMWTRASSTSFKTLPKIEMLSLEYITKCADQTELKEIVTVLAAEQSYPFLLRAAKERLTTVGRDEQQNTTTITTNRRVSSIKNDNESTLVMSLSSDDEDDDASVSRMPPPRNRSSQKLLATERTNRPHELYQQIHRLTQTIVEKENARLQEQKDFWHKLQGLEDAKATAESNIAALEGVITASTSATNDLLLALEQMREENQLLHSHLERERDIHESKQQEDCQKEKELISQVQELTKKLSAAERQLEDRTLERKNHELNQLLRSAQRNLEDVKKDRDVMIRSLLHATGREDTSLKQLSKQDREQLVVDFSKKSSASRTALDAMAKALAQTEDDLRRTKLAQQKTEWQLEDARKVNRQLKCDNLSLTKQIQQLSDELTASRAYADELIKTSQDRHHQEWEQREAMYKQIIRGLKKQLSKEESMVPVGLYKSAVADAKLKAEELKDRQEEIQGLTSKLAALEIEQYEKQRHQGVGIIRKKNRSISNPKARGKVKAVFDRVRSKTKRTHPVHETAHKMTPPAQIEPLKTPKTPHTSEKPIFAFSPIVPENADRSQMRVSMVRAAGGRKGLEDMLKKKRSPRAQPAKPLQERNW